MWEMQAISSSQGQNLDNLHNGGIGAGSFLTHNNGTTDSGSVIVGIDEIRAPSSLSSISVIGNRALGGCRLSDCGGSDSSLNNNNNNNISNSNTNTHSVNSCEQHQLNVNTTPGHHIMQIDLIGGAGNCHNGGSAGNTQHSHSTNNVLGTGNNIIIASTDGIGTTNITNIQSPPPLPPSNSNASIPYGLEINSVLLETADGLLHPTLREARAINIGNFFFHIYFVFNIYFIFFC